MTIAINTAFDSGNITVAAVEQMGAEGERHWRVDLNITADHQSDFYQWFHFRVAGAAGTRVTFRILNAGRSAYPFGWPGYRVRASIDRIAWRMTPTHYAEGVLEWE